MRKTNDDIILKMLEEGHTQKEIAEHFRVSNAAICKRVKRLEAYPKIINDLTPQQQRFVQSIAEGKSQTQSAMDAYEVSSLPSAKSLGSQLMKKPKIEAAVSEWMDYHGLTRDYRVKTLRKHVDNRDPNVSLKALEQSWKLGGNYHETHLHVEMNIDDLMQSKQESERRLAELYERRKELQAKLDEVRKQEGVIDVDEED